MQATKQPTIPSFAAYRSDRTLYPHIQRAFLKDMEVTEEDLAIGYMILDDGTEWGIVLEGNTEAKILARTGECYCIISFQLWKDGSKHAVCKANRAYYKHLGELGHEE